jgi:hypothetical protein
VDQAVSKSYFDQQVSTVFGAIAQLGERNTGSVEVSGSIPLSSTKQETGTRKGAGFFVLAPLANR